MAIHRETQIRTILPLPHATRRTTQGDSHDASRGKMAAVMPLPPRPLSYSELPPRRPWKRYVLGAAALPTLYVAAYLALRLTGVYYLFFNQGGWDMDGTTRVAILDASFAPAAFVELELQNRLRWVREPTGP